MSTNSIQRFSLHLNPIVNEEFRVISSFPDGSPSFDKNAFNQQPGYVVTADKCIYKTISINEEEALIGLNSKNAVTFWVKEDEGENKVLLATPVESLLLLQEEPIVSFPLAAPSMELLFETAASNGKRNRRGMLHTFKEAEREEEEVYDGEAATAAAAEVARQTETNASERVVIPLSGSTQKTDEFFDAHIVQQAQRVARQYVGCGGQSISLPIILKQILSASPSFEKMRKETSEISWEWFSHAKELAQNVLVGNYECIVKGNHVQFP